MDWLKAPVPTEGSSTPSPILTPKPKSKEPRKVILLRASGRCSIVDALPSDSGWVAQWCEDEDEISILLPKGKVEGTSKVTGWKPHRGWENDKEYL